MHGAFGSALGDMRAGSWKNAEELLAVIGDGVHNLIYLTELVNTDPKKGRRPKPPRRIPRPWEKARETKKRNATPDEIAAMFGGRVKYVPKE